ncbi:MAG: addiction module protein [Alphaproteobacteria bacterium]|nr:addiction module protein [Alphaproteobacteria bacterium]MCW5739173.1 addiction module protein [Alphaproteobacteria bacterium]
MDIRTIDTSRLTVAERLDLTDRLWASIEDERAPAANGQEPPELIAELRRRLAAHERDPSSAIPLEEAFRRLRRRRA